MAKEYKCPSCQVSSVRGARRCSNPECRAELGLCSHCRDIVAVVHETNGANGLKFLRARLSCAKCGERVVRCRTTQLGGACNGLARANGPYAHQFCDDCSGKAFDLATKVGVFALGTAVAGFLRRSPKR